MAPVPMKKNLTELVFILDTVRALLDVLEAVSSRISTIDA